MKHLFIGGSADGRWIEVPEGRGQFRVAQPPPACGALRRGPVHEEKLWLGVDVYRALRVADPDGLELTLFVLDGERNPMRLLAENYRPGVVINGFLRSNPTIEDHKEMSDYLSRGGRPREAICLCPNIA